MFASLRILQPPEIEPVTVDMVRTHLRVDADYDDTSLSLYSLSARMWAENYTNRSFITQQWQYNITTSPPPVSTSLVPQSLIVFPLNWPPHIRKPVNLPRSRVVSLDSFEYGMTGDLQPADPDDYIANLDVEPAQIMISSPLVPMIPAQQAQFQYTAGYGPGAADVPVPIQHAILILSAWMFENRGDVDAPDIPMAAINLLNPYRLWQFAG